MWNNVKADLRNLFKRRNTYSEEEFVDVIIAIFYEEVIMKHHEAANIEEDGSRSCAICRSL